MKSRPIRNFGKIGDAIPVGDLVEVQLKSYARFLQAGVAPADRKRQGLEDLFQEIFPIVSYDKTMELEYIAYELEKPRYTIQQCRELRLTYGHPLKIRCRLKRKDADDISEQVIYLGEMPMMIGGGEFIVNGAERVIVNQLHRSPGVDFVIDSRDGDRILHGSRIIPERGSWIEISVTKKDVMVIRIDQSSKIPATAFLRAMDEKFGKTEDILRLFYKNKIEKVKVKKLEPTMWTVGPIVDTETGEVLVKAGMQLGDSVVTIQNSSLGDAVASIQGATLASGDSREDVETQVKDWMKKNLEFITVPVVFKPEEVEKMVEQVDAVLGAETGRKGKDALETLLKRIEDRLMIEFPDSKNQPKQLPLPMFNREAPKNLTKKGGDEVVKSIKSGWENDIPETLKEIFNEAKEQVSKGKKAKWKNDPEQAPKDPGIYIFREKKTCKVVYVGIAGERSLHGRLRMHYTDKSLKSNGLLNDSLKDSIAKAFGFYEAGPKETKRSRGRSSGLDSVEVICGDVETQVKDWMKKNLEFSYIDCPSLSDGDIGLLEERLMLEFPSGKNNVKNLPDIPRFNKKLNNKKAVTAKDIRKRWDEKATTEMQEKFAECLHKFKDKKGEWFAPDNIPTKKQDATITNKGIYAYRDLATKDVTDGYVGKAGERRGRGLRDRLGMHYEKDKSLRKDGSLNDNLKGSIAKAFGFYETESKETKRSRGGSGTLDSVEVIRGAVDPLILNTLSEDDCPDHEKALLRIYGRLRPGNPTNIDKARMLFKEKFYDTNRYRLGKVGRFRLNRKFKQNVPEDEMSLRPDDFLNTMKYVIGLRNNEGVTDDIDHLGNRRLRTVDELAASEIRKGLLKLRRTVQERMSMKGQDDVTRIADLVNSKSVSSSIDYFFGRGELSQVVDQTNSLSQMTHERRLSALGPGGLNRKRAGFEVRDVHISHYGRVCPIETPEGTNIGLIVSLAIFAKVDEYGFLVTPYREVKRGKLTGEHEYLRADQEMEAIFAPPSMVEPKTNRLRKGLVLARREGDLTQVDSALVNYVDISPKQTVGISASLIPFLEHDDANRALMGSNMQRQSVPLLVTERPLVGTGMEVEVAKNSSMAIRARSDGKVTDVDSRRIVIDGADEYKLLKYEGLNERTCLNQKPIVDLGDKVKKDQIIADGGGTCNGSLALGRNLLVGFVPFDGYNFEDAILISERLVRDDVFTSIHIDEFSIEVRETKLGREEFTRDIPNVSEKALRNLDEYGVVCEGTRISTGDILVGKVSPKSKTELTPEEKLLHAIFGRAGEDVKNDSLEMPSGYSGVVIKTKRFARRGAGSEEQREAHKEDIVRYGAEMVARECLMFRQMMQVVQDQIGVEVIDSSTRQKVGVSDDNDVIYEQIENFDIAWIKPAKKRAAVRGIVDKYLFKLRELKEEKEAMLIRMKHGDELSSGVLEMVKIYVATKRTLSIGDKMAGRHGNKGVIAKILPEEDMPFMEDGTPLDICLNPLGVPSRMNVGQILETHLGWAAKILGFDAITPVFEGATEDDIRELMGEVNGHVRDRITEIEKNKQVPPVGELFVTIPKDLKMRIYDGRTGERLEQEVTVGHMYVMKLHHLVDDKIHARATGPYSLITQQPLGGKARTGGQRFGEMEVWALEAYGAAYTLQELLTVKSDDIEGRTKIYESMVKGNNTLEAGTPISFDVLCNEIRGLGLNIQLEKKRLGSSLI